jgi:hypothetical protein
MEDFDRIRERLRETTTDEREQDRLIELFDTACSGLESGMARGVKAETEDRLENLLRDFERKAEAVKERIRE